MLLHVPVHRPLAGPARRRPVGLAGRHQAQQLPRGQSALPLSWRLSSGTAPGLGPVGRGAELWRPHARRPAPARSPLGLRAPGRPANQDRTRAALGAPPAPARPSTQGAVPVGRLVRRPRPGHGSCAVAAVAPSSGALVPSHCHSSSAATRAAATSCAAALIDARRRRLDRVLVRHLVRRRIAACTVSTCPWASRAERGQAAAPAPPAGLAVGVLGLRTPTQPVQLGLLVKAPAAGWSGPRRNRSDACSASYMASRQAPCSAMSSARCGHAPGRRPALAGTRTSGQRRRPRLRPAQIEDLLTPSITLQ